MKELFTPEELTNLGFIEQQNEPLEDGGTYRWWMLKKNDSTITFTIEYTLRFTPRHHYIEFNGETLKGRKITQKDFETLIELM